MEQKKQTNHVLRNPKQTNESDKSDNSDKFDNMNKQMKLTNMRSLRKEQYVHVCLSECRHACAMATVAARACQRSPNCSFCSHRTLKQCLCAGSYIYKPGPVASTDIWSYYTSPCIQRHASTDMVRDD